MTSSPKFEPGPADIYTIERIADLVDDPGILRIIADGAVLDG